MIKFRKILQEEVRNKQLKRVAFIQQVYQKANTGELNKEGIKKIAARLENGGVLRYAGFPEWVLNSWINPASFPVLPLKNNRWFEPRSLVNGTGEVDALDLTYGGWSSDENRNIESSIITVNLARDPEIDVKKYAQLTLFKRAVNEAKKIIANRKQRSGEMVGQNQINTMSGSVY